ncbi:MAG: homoserine dehydrogenase [Lachnospiraceae bacterium]|nr:homoserine dehydrogenase [Lachnospiraceae bacterium]
MIKVAVLGYGTVGSGIVEVINTNKDLIAKRVGEEIEVAYVLDLRDFPGDPVEKILVHDVDVIMNDPSVSIVAEAMGGVEPAYTFAKRAIESGKSFCTSNKELVAKHGAKLIAMAKEHNVNFLFEASVGGGIPIIRPLIHSISPENVVEVSGILNGTTNYILTKMTKEGLDFDSVLKDAQDKGFAERNPEADIEGYDACRKIAILASLAFGAQVDFEDIHTEGISKITDKDIEYAKAMGMAIKLIGSAKNEEGKISAMVAPMLVGPESSLYAVNDVFNAITVTGNTLSDVMFYGKGAGKLPTASAVVSDIIEEAKNLNRNIRIVWEEEKINLSAFEDINNRFFVRLSGNDKLNEDKVKEVFGDVKVVSCDLIKDEYAFTTKVLSEGVFADKTKEFDNVVNVIRIK